ncbi:hypothetical protein DFJ74DRAFT_385586 [Hyaloraphidium curvatum]|nr:hypothetical protein DFJ74DRAFT_385586 [Hyaloraphidium curvatum]
MLGHPAPKPGFLDDLRGALDAVVSADSAAFATAGRLADMTPAVSVAGVGNLVFPLDKAQAVRLVQKAATVAPYGRGTETLVDTNVRRAWKIDADKVTFGKEWEDDTLPSLVKLCCDELGIRSDEMGVEAQLHNMLVYLRGGHFLRHRDTEKEPGMFGTLIVQLPATHEGGDLVVEHAGKTQVFSFSAKSSWANRVGYAAFFADCEHTLESVTSGVRLVLAYNLVRTTSGSPPAPLASALDNVAAAVSAWTASPSAPSRLAIRLDHLYTSQSLSFDALKGKDRLLVEALREAALPSGVPSLDVCLALVELHEVGEPEHDPRMFEGKRRGQLPARLPEGPVAAQDGGDQRVALLHLGMGRAGGEAGGAGPVRGPREGPAGRTGGAVRGDPGGQEDHAVHGQLGPGAGAVVGVRDYVETNRALIGIICRYYSSVVIFWPRDRQPAPRRAQEACR